MSICVANLFPYPLQEIPGMASRKGKSPSGDRVAPGEDFKVYEKKTMYQKHLPPPRRASFSM